MDHSGPSRAPLLFTGPGTSVPGAVPLVPDLRAVELSAHPLLHALRPLTGRLSREALALAEALTPALPAALRERPDPETPSLWECFRHEFARYSLAPALMNLEIARAALQEHPGGAVQFTDRIGGAWLLGGSGAGEAVAEACRETGRRLTGTPGPLARRLRPRAARHGAPRAPRAFAHCWDCETREEERLGAQTCDVLFLGLAATLAPFIAHLAPRLEAEGLRCLTVDTHCEGSTAALRRAGVRVVDGRPSLYGGEAAAAEARRAWRGWAGEAAAGVRELVRAGTLSPWLGEFVALRLLVTCARDLPEIAAFRAAAGTLLGSLQPRLVAGSHLSADFLAPYLLGAHLRGARSLWYQHGIRGPVHRHGMGLPWGNMLCFGQYTRDLYADLMYPDTAWVLAGNPLYDELLAAGLPPAAPVRERLDAGSRAVVLLATQSDEPQVKAAAPRWWVTGVAEACRERGALLVVKLHPVETAPELYDGLAAALPETVRVFGANELDLREALAAADLLVTRDSTVIYEAALAGKPALSVTLPPYLPRFPLAEHGGATWVSAYEAIAPVLGDLLAGADREARAARRDRFLEYHLGPQDGHATERMVAAFRATAGS